MISTLTRDTVLTIDELAKALRCHRSTIKRADLPCFYIGPRTKRYVWGEVLDTLAASPDVTGRRRLGLHRRKRHAA